MDRIKEILIRHHPGVSIRREDLLLTKPTPSGNGVMVVNVKPTIESGFYFEHSLFFQRINLNNVNPVPIDYTGVTNTHDILDAVNKATNSLYVVSEVTIPSLNIKEKVFRKLFLTKDDVSLEFFEPLYFEGQTSLITIKASDNSYFFENRMRVALTLKTL